MKKRILVRFDEIRSCLRIFLKTLENFEKLLRNLTNSFHAFGRFKKNLFLRMSGIYIKSLRISSHPNECVLHPHSSPTILSI